MARISAICQMNYFVVFCECKAEWHASDWGSCSSNCGTGGVQLRLLSCVWTITRLPAGRNCEGRRPPAARSCPHADSLPPCRPTALPLQQDESCEDNSRYCDIIKLRLLSCVWTITRLPAGRNCEGRRPPAARSCPHADSLPPCRPTALPLQQDESCEDNSRYCDIIKVFHSCDSEEVRQKCCATCKYVDNRRR
ncbi:hypothetical protein DICVIV_13889 [Dictyocaulus viviparus]|uniref:PLAC domain-containing protein n=1 Tax=Dictyocaulus viviparus TaxID=29172 RepID=A0A0D8X6Q1_DICVI|nr:hypothetical protein DICVIV_13889 [Dictyocaulus viviparus]